MKKVPIRRIDAYRQKKSTGIVADTVANVIAALLTYIRMTHNAAIRAVARAGEGKDRAFDRITRNPVCRYFNERPLSLLLMMSSGHAHSNYQLIVMTL